VVSEAGGAPSRALLHDMVSGWDTDRIEAMRAASEYNKAKLSQLDAICIVQDTADVLVCHDAGLATQRAAIEAWTSRIAEIGTLLDKSERDLKTIIEENPVIAKADGMAFGESVELQDLWYEKQEDFINLFVSHRDRYLAILRGTKLVGIGKAKAAAAEEAAKEAYDNSHLGYADCGLLGQYHRLDE
jgi:hypothetical protein